MRREVLTVSIVLYCIVLYCIVYMFLVLPNLRSGYNARLLSNTDCTGSLAHGALLSCTV